MSAELIAHAVATIGAIPTVARSFYIDAIGAWEDRVHPSPIGPPARPWTYSGPWQVGDLVRLTDQDTGEHAGTSVLITAIEDAAECPDHLSIADRAYYDKFEARIEYAIVFDGAQDAAIHREWGGSMTSSSYAIHFDGFLIDRAA